MLPLLALLCLQACRHPEPVLLGNAAAEFFAPAGVPVRFTKMELSVVPKWEEVEVSDPAKVDAVVARLKRMRSDASVDVHVKWCCTGFLTLTRSDGQVLELSLMVVPERLVFKVEQAYYSDDWLLTDWCDAIR